MIFWTNDHNIEWIIWYLRKIVDHVWSKNSILVDFLGNRNGASAGWNVDLSLKNAFLSGQTLNVPLLLIVSKFKNNTRKWYFEYFIADYFPTFNKKDPVLMKKIEGIYKQNKVK